MDVGAEEIRAWHKQKGWQDIGYHFVVRRDGTLETGRDIDGDGDILEEVGAHALGYNANSIGICLAGGKAHNGAPEFNFTQQQLDTLRSFLVVFTALLPGVEIIGHNQVSDKACPGFDVSYWWYGQSGPAV
jgi:N-acetylmuramoyl-L-alanine amidase